MYAIDWKLVLEFLKASGPFVTVTGVYLTARMSLRNFRHQKSLERRIDWYEAMGRGIMEIVAPPFGKDLPIEVRLEALLLTTGQAQFYADAEGLAAARRLAITLHEIATDKVPRVDREKILIEACRQARKALAKEIRKDLNLKNIDVSLGPEASDEVRLPK